MVDGLGREGMRVTLRMGEYDALGRSEGWRMENGAGEVEQYEQLSFDRYGRIEKSATDDGTVWMSYEPIPAELTGGVSPGSLEGVPGAREELLGGLKRLSYDFNRDGSIEAIQTIERYGLEDPHARALKSRNYYLDGRTPDATRDGISPMAPSVSRGLQYTPSGKIKELSGFADRGVRAYQYDGVGSLKTTNRYRGGVWQGGESYHYDAKGNRTGVYTLDGMGREMVQKEGGEYGYSNRLASYSHWIDKQPSVCRYLDGQGHDRLGRLTVDPVHCGKGDEVHYGWDVEGNLSRIEKDANNFIELTYQADGHLQSVRETQAGVLIKDLSYVWVGNSLRQIRDNQQHQRLLMSFNGDGYKTYR